MMIKDFLSPADTIVGLRASDKARLLHDLADRAAARLNLDATHVTQELLKREDLGSTGVGNGIAIPHARLSGLARPFGFFARLKRPIDFDAIDGEPVDLVFLLLQPAPAPAQGDSLNALAAVSRKLRESDRLEKLRAAEDDAEFYLEITR
jgi:PTS system nitrogen regulatory IIA component